MDGGKTVLVSRKCKPPLAICRVRLFCGAD